MLVHIKKLFAGDVRGKFAYPAFDTQDLETTLGIIQAAEELNVPVIIATSEGTIQYAGLTTIYAIMATLAQSAKVPIVLHMDHGKDIEQIKKGVELGYSSVMIDHSALPYEQNVADTQAVIDFAHAAGAWVQGEIGRMRGTEDWVSVEDQQALLTEPEEALKYYQATHVDTLACSVGTIHGLIKIRGGVTAHVDLPRIKAIAGLVNIPLVLHGASGVDENTISQAILNGIAIINIDTELRLAFAGALRKFLPANPEEVDPRQIMKPVIEAVKQKAMEKIRQFKTQNLLN